MKMLSLFSGIGGIDLAAQWAGIETVAFCERDKFCQKILAKHWPGVHCYDDIKTLKGSEILARHGNIDIVAGGFPCQPFSQAGKRRGAADDRHLWPEMFRIIKEVRPTWVVGENVTGIIGMELENVLIDMENENYETQTFIIPACGVNAPHKRNRVFIVGYSASTRLFPSTQTGIYSKEESRRVWNEEPERRSDYVANANGPRCEELDTTAESTESRFNTGCDNARDVPDTSCELSHGFWKERNRRTEFTNSGWWSIEPDVGRLAHGVSARVAKLKALGNAVVPQQIYPIFKAIMEVLK